MPGPASSSATILSGLPHQCGPAQGQHQTSKACPLRDQPSALSRSKGAWRSCATDDPRPHEPEQTANTPSLPSSSTSVVASLSPMLQELLAPWLVYSSEPMSYYPFCSSRFFRLVRHHQQRLSVDPTPLHPLELDLDNCFQRGRRYRWESQPLLS